MSTDKVNRQIKITKEKIRKAKGQIASLEKTVEELERKQPRGVDEQSMDQDTRRQHSI